ncbi:S8 family serine peptidase [Catellatospora methionotrophica]|uniref:S8 family serine peptidase n=1 Tax=Catellatospora methionotrophica TaxID=121620 RepID=UPI0033D9C085
MREAIAVGATDRSDRIAAFSNIGPCVDVFAPGVGILSADRDSDTDTDLLNGTSMAASHVAGAISLLLRRDGWSTATPAQVETEIKNSATRAVIGSPALTTDRLLFTSPPPPFGGPSVALARHADGKLDIFGVNRDGLMFHRSLASPGSSTWGPWVQATEVGWWSVAADTHDDGRVELVELARTEDVWRRRQANTNIDFWSTWRQLDGKMTASAVARNEDGRLEMFGADRLGQTWVRWQTSENALTWSP